MLVYESLPVNNWKITPIRDRVEEVDINLGLV